MEPRTPQSIGRLDQLHRELGLVRRRNGLAIERGECFPHIGCVGLALRGPEGPVAAISVVGDDSSALELVAPLVVNVVRTVSEELLETPGPDRHEALVG
jgi:DNA-binding IclR family transcriptional regulator